jgi:hypothetical protein
MRNRPDIFSLTRGGADVMTRWVQYHAAAAHAVNDYY